MRFKIKASKHLLREDAWLVVRTINSQWLYSSYLGDSGVLLGRGLDRVGSLSEVRPRIGPGICGFTDDLLVQMQHGDIEE